MATENENSSTYLCFGVLWLWQEEGISHSVLVLLVAGNMHHLFATALFCRNEQQGAAGRPGGATQGHTQVQNGFVLAERQTGETRDRVPGLEAAQPDAALQRAEGPHQNRHRRREGMSGTEHIILVW